MSVRFSNEHRTAAQRRAQFDHYIHDAYPETESRPLSDQWLTEIRETPEFQANAAVVSARASALSLLALGKPQEALVAIQPAVKSSYFITPWVSDLAGSIYQALGDVDQADAAYDLPEKLPASGDVGTALQQLKSRQTLPSQIPAFGQDADGYVAHVGLLVGAGRYEKAQAKIAEAERHFGPLLALLPDKLAIALRTRNFANTQDIIHACKTSEPVSDRMNCSTALQGVLRSLADDPPSADERAKLRMLLELPEIAIGAEHSTGAADKK